MTKTRIKLTRKHFTGSRLILAISPSWISNGHWMIASNLIQNAPTSSEIARAAFPFLANVLERTDGQMAELIPTDLDVEYARSSWLYMEPANNTLCRVYFTPAGVLVFINEIYAELIGAPGTLYGSANRNQEGPASGPVLANAPTRESVTCVVMPICEGGVPRARLPMEAKETNHAL